jgi:hypothetical protein
VPEIKQSTVDALAPLARPFEPLDDFLLRLASFYRERNGAGEAAPTNGYARRGETGAHRAGVRNFNPNSPPDIRHTKLVKAVFAGHEMPNPRWNDLVRHAHEVAFDASDRSFNKLRAITTANIHEGKKTVEGYSPVGDRGFSLQGVAANDALRIVLGIARKLHTQLEVIFDWRDKEGAAYPGETGRVIWEP